MMTARIELDRRELCRRYELDRRTLVLNCVREFTRLGERRQAERRTGILRDNAAVNLWEARFHAARA